MRANDMEPRMQDIQQKAVSSPQFSLASYPLLVVCFVDNVGQIYAAMTKLIA